MQEEESSMGWVYYARLVDTAFQAKCLAARIEHAHGWMYRQMPVCIGIFQTRRGRYGVKILWS
jgi:hypothetical protein